MGIIRNVALAGLAAIVMACSGGGSDSSAGDCNPPRQLYKGACHDPCKSSMGCAEGEECVTVPGVEVKLCLPAEQVEEDLRVQDVASETTIVPEVSSELTETASIPLTCFEYNYSNIDVGDKKMSIINTPEGYAVSGTSYDYEGPLRYQGMLMLLDQSGISKRFTFGDENDQVYQDVVQDEEGNFVVVGYNYQKSENEKLMVAKISPDGTLMNQKEFGEGIAFAIVKLEQGGFAVGGFRGFYNGGQVLKLDDYLNQVGEPIEITEEDGDSIYSLTTTSQGLLLGMRNWGGSSVMHIDLEGQVLGVHKIQGDNHYSVASVQVLATGGYLAMTTPKKEDSQATAMVLSPNLEALWEYTMPDYVDSYGKSAYLTAEGTYLLAASALYEEQGKGVFLELGPDKQVLWKKEITGSPDVIMTNPAGGRVLLWHYSGEASVAVVDKYGQQCK